MDKQKLSFLIGKADEIRKSTIECIGKFGAGHIGGSVSVTEALTAIYFETAKVDPKNPKWADRDRIVMSKGHAGPGIFATLAHKGYFDFSVLDTLNKPGTKLPSHCDMNKTIGIDMTAGSLGQGLSCAVGMAIAGKMDKKDYTVYCIVGDGESQEGQIWEAIMLAKQYKLNNLIILIDNNKMQIDGETNNICGVAPYDKKFEAFGYNTYNVDGHNIEEIVNAINLAKKSIDAPNAIILDTIKGKGVKCCEGKVSSHSVSFTEQEWKAEVNGGCKC